MTANDFYERRAGVLLHPTSLPSGVLDEDADRWLEVMVEAGLSVWQVLPLGEPTHGLSPYQCISAFAMNPALYRVTSSVQPDSDSFRAFCTQNPWVDDSYWSSRSFSSAAWLRHLYSSGHEYHAAASNFSCSNLNST